MKISQIWKWAVVYKQCANTGTFKALVLIVFFFSWRYWACYIKENTLHQLIYIRWIFNNIQTLSLISIVSPKKRLSKCNIIQVQINLCKQKLERSLGFWQDKISLWYHSASYQRGISVECQCLIEAIVWNHLSAPFKVIRRLVQSALSPFGKSVRMVSSCI